MSFHHLNGPDRGNHVGQRFVFLTEADMIAFTNEQSGIVVAMAITLSADDNGSIAQVGASAPYDFFVLRDWSGPTWAKIHGGNVKSGLILPGVFSGTPKKASVVFGTPFLNDQYSIAVGVETDGTRTYAPEYESKLNTGFTVNLHSNGLTGLVGIGWHAVPYGS
jgi:hypothetical protein